ncbi:SusC/RagA family TonB-linked outer membrane protein [Niabella beijingensis]|uniref:SusC/RagA family TonB-linked outer membrane protein n=1 Tax=Niabella beijingensis TaxID=2872700 RepID=UPI001CBC5B1D|nr:TonB-dependent receptor [Niabella beijingensis]MBZ4190135.1 TonB-dependent receptor [Niabella beijingensis]
MHLLSRYRCKRLCSYCMLLLSCMLCMFSAMAAPPETKKIQTSVEGVVTNTENKPVEGATVTIEGRNSTTLTDANGSFSLNVEPGDYTLTVSHVSYTTEQQTIHVRAGETLRLAIKMKLSQAADMNEVVVVGYGTQKKVNLTGAVDQVTSKVLENRSVPNLAQGLQGQIPNLNLVPRDGKPINSPAYNIRGTTSIGQGGNALVLIDGVEGDPSKINPNDVASVSVLKDASSAAIYGARAAFGVVLITTKNPVKGKTMINYSFNQSVKSPTTVPDFVTDGYTFAKMFNEAWTAWNDYSQTPKNVNKTVKFSPAYLEELERRSKDPSLPKVDINSDGEYVYYDNTDWYKLLYKDHLPASEHNLTISGGSEKSDFLVTGRYFKQAGLFRYNSDDYSVYNVRAKGSLQVFNWLNIYTNNDFSQMKYHNPINVGEGGGIWQNIADEGHTMVPMLNPDGTLTYSGAYTVGDFYLGQNGIDMDQRVLRSTVGFNSKFFNNRLRVKGDYTLTNTNNDQVTKRVPVPYSTKPGVIQYVGTNYNDYQNQNQTTQYFASNTYVEYEPQLGNGHYFKGLVGYNYEQSTYKQIAIGRNGLMYPGAEDLSLALGQSATTSGGWRKWVTNGGFYRLNYSYKDRYLVEFNGRYDGSSRFPENQRYAFFPSVSAGWRISNESFWEGLKNAVNDFKIRGSYGSLGNGAIAPYRFMELFTIRQSDRVLNGVRPQYTDQPNVLPDGLTWEASRTVDLGIDLGLFRNKLTLVADAYIRKTIGMFTNAMTQPAVYGVDPAAGANKFPKGNYADLTTRGWEASLSWRDDLQVGGKPFNYGVRFTMSDYIAKVDKFNNPTKLLTDYYEGQRVGEIWGYVNERYFTASDFNTDGSLKTGIPTQIGLKASTSGKFLPGDIKFADLNGDGAINNGDNTVDKPGDRRIIGNSLPRYTYGISLDATWNNISFSVFFQGVGHQDWYPGAEAKNFWGQYNRPYNKVPTYQLGRIWSEENPDAYFPRYRGYSAQNGSAELTPPQTKYLQNVAYLRMKNIQLGYNLPANWISRIRMTNARIYVSGENLLTFSPLYKLTKNIDPENASQPVDQVAASGSGALGMNYPMLKGITFGLSVNF